MKNGIKIAVVIPSFRVTRHIRDVVDGIPDFVDAIYVIDDTCPDGSGDIAETSPDPRVKILRHETNKGVGGAVMTGYQQALDDGMQVMVKIDGDGQMDPTLIGRFVQPILDGRADYTKGNRFWDLEQIRQMPAMRLFGNAVLSLMTKFSSGYWNAFDPTNGFTALSATAAEHLPFDKISERYFFETDMMFRLNTIRAVVIDIPMDAKYEDEESNLKISRIIGEFLFKHIRNFFKRVFYNYFLRDMSIASLQLPIGILLTLFGIIFGISSWISSSVAGVETSAGTVMIAALPLIVGFQLMLAFLSYDMQTMPNRPITSLINPEGLPQSDNKP